MRYIPDPQPGAGDQEFFAAELASNECWCGKRKQGGRAFCFKCYVRLPEDLRAGLYRKLGKGFEAAYEAAYQFLQ
jgi:hypothetical protein